MVSMRGGRNVSWVIFESQLFEAVQKFGILEVLAGVQLKLLKCVGDVVTWLFGMFSNCGLHVFYIMFYVISVVSFGFVHADFD